MSARDAASEADGRLLYLAENLTSLHAAPDLPWLVGRFEFLGAKALGAAVTAVAVPDETGVYRVCGSASPRPAAERDLWDELEIDGLPRNVAARSLFEEAERAGQPLAVDLSSCFPGHETAGGVATAIITPLLHNREMLGAGVFVVDLAPLNLRIASVLAAHAAVAMFQLRQQDEARRLHSVDPHLWVPDEHFLVEQLRREVSRARRYRREVGLAVIRLDNEPEIRQRFGDFFTNQLLRRIGSQLLTEVRDSDVLGALAGGYAIIHTETPLAGTVHSAERLREVVARMIEQRFPEVPEAVVSAATSGFPTTANTVEEMVASVVPADAGEDGRPSIAA